MARHWLRAAGAALAAAVLLLGVAGCGLVPSRPDGPAWDQAARQSLEDAASEVATVKVALEQQQKGHLLGKYGVTTVTDSEEALGLAQDSILTQQPPTSRQEGFDKVAAALGDAGDLVTEARIALVRDDTRAYAGLVHRLDAMSGRLDDLRGSL